MDSQSANSDSSGQASSVFESRSPQSSTTSGIPPRAEEWDRTLWHTDLTEFGRALGLAARTVFPNSEKSRYSRIYVLLICWQTQDPKLPVEEEIEKLREVFEHVYHFEVEQFRIPNSDSHGEVSEKINAFVKVNKNNSDDLKIVYYAGHSRLSRTKELVWSTYVLNHSLYVGGAEPCLLSSRLPEKKNKKCPTVMWSGIQRSLEMARSDVLILLDCCSSGVCNASEGNGATELICACAFNSEANGVGHYSFTHALTTELRFLSRKPCFSVGELYTSVYTRMQSHLPQGIMNERYPALIHLVLTQDEPFIRGIQLSVQALNLSGDSEQRKCERKRVCLEDDETRLPDDLQTNALDKRPRLNDTMISEVEDIILPWIDSSTDVQDEDNTNPTSHCDGERLEKVNEQKLRASPESKWKDSLCENDAPRALFMIRFQEDVRAEDLSIELFREWLRSIPAAAEEVVIEAAFKSFSTMIFVSLPLSMTSYIPSSHAINFLGPVRSSIMLPCGHGNAHSSSEDVIGTADSSRKRHQSRENDGAMSLYKDPIFSNLENLLDLYPYYSRSEPTQYFHNIWAHNQSYEYEMQTWISPHIQHTSHAEEEPGEKVSEVHASAPADIYIRNILDKFPQADPTLAQRLGEANWQRHVDIRRRNLVSERVQEDVAGSVFHPASTFHDSGLGASINAASTYAVSVSSLITTAADTNNRFFKVPPMPKEVVDGVSFDCSVCGQTIPPLQIKNLLDWK